MTSRQIQYLVGLLVVLLIGVGLVVLADTNRKKLAAKMEAEKASALMQADKAAAPSQESKAASETAEAVADDVSGKPSFDVARFEPTGDGVLAGLAKPGAIVELLADGQPISTTTANEVGEWVIVLENPLDAGSHDLTVRATVPEGEPALSEDFIAVIVPETPSGEVLVVASRPGQASEILARPSASAAPDTSAPDTSAKADSTAEIASAESAEPAGTEAGQQQAAAETGAAAESAAETQVTAADTKVAPDAEMEKPVDQADAADGSAPVGGAADVSQEKAAEAVDVAAVTAPAAGAAEDAEAVAEQAASVSAAVEADSQSAAEQAVASVSEAVQPDATTKAPDGQTEAAEMTDTASAGAASQSADAAAAMVEGQSAEAQTEQVARADPASEAAETAAAPETGTAQSEPAVSTGEMAANPDAPVAETSVTAVSEPESAAPVTEQAASAPAEEQQTAAVQSEAESKPVAKAPKRQFKLALDAVETEGSMVYAAGTGNPGTRVRVYADDSFIGETSANDDGRWLLETNAEIAAGNVVVRADEMASGSADVIRRAEVPFFKQADAIALLPTTATGSGGASEASSGVIVTAPKSVIIRSGDNLWTISRRTYGRGIRYTTIYQANDEQIRDPHMIFPGQVFVLPEGDKTWTQ